MSGDQLDLLMPPASHNQDPVTSYRAEREITASGHRKTQCHAVLEAVRDCPGRTGAELAILMNSDKYTVRRRLSDLLHNNKVKQGYHRKCTQAQRDSVTWWPCQQ